MRASSFATMKATSGQANLDAGLSDTQSRIIAVVGRIFAERRADVSIALETDLREAGLSSVDMVNLVLSIEDEFNLTIPEVQITPANLRSVSAISLLVDRLGA